MTSTTKSPLEQHMHEQLVRMLVQRAIFCPRTNAVLDVRTCVVFVDSDGDPRAVMSQAGYQDLITEPDRIERLREMGLVVDESTVKAPKE